MVREAQAETAAPLAITSADLSKARRVCIEVFESMIFVLRPQISVMPRQPYSRSIVNDGPAIAPQWCVSARPLPGSPSRHAVSGRRLFTIGRIAPHRVGIVDLFPKRKILCRAARAKR
nr:hypothetical protein [uncultured Sphingomonas sp.]